MAALRSTQGPPWPLLRWRAPRWHCLCVHNILQLLYRGPAPHIAIAVPCTDNDTSTFLSPSSPLSSSVSACDTLARWEGLCARHDDDIRISAMLISRLPSPRLFLRNLCLFYSSTRHRRMRNTTAATLAIVSASHHLFISIGLAGKYHEGQARGVSRKSGNSYIIFSTVRVNATTSELRAY